MRNMLFWCRRSVFVALVCVGLIPPLGARAAETVRVGVLKFGTVNWELDTIKHHKIGEKHGVDVDVRFFAGEDATSVALMAGEVDFIVSDWLWVSRQRASGEDLTMFPYSTSVGALMVPSESPIKSLADLKGKKIGVAGGPIDKSWLLLQGLARKEKTGDLAADNDIAYGAPPLLAEKAQQGELDAVLNFWHYCARLEAAGFRRLVSANDAAEALGASGPVSALGYIFHESWAKAHPDAIAGFMAASAEAKALLGSSDEEWLRLAPIIKADGQALTVLRDRYREGIPNRAIEDEEKDAAALYAVLADLGGEKLVGSSKTLMPGTYWRAK
ncbi:ABC transporter substrate-binding protein [Ciceribacter sp. RN22]|uniref:ABC transporter substrate-binding protein n=1 Tax=Ciceribacter sp. RN22 TaxID=2954932 RepID=UPI0035B200C9